MLLYIKLDTLPFILKNSMKKITGKPPRPLRKKHWKKFARPCFLIAGSNLDTDAEELLHGFEYVLGKDVNVNGCMAGDDFAFKENFVFSNGKGQ